MPILSTEEYTYDYLVNKVITSLCCGYCLINASRSAISKSAKSKPGATVQPTRLKVSALAGLLANQQPAFTTA